MYSPEGPRKKYMYSIQDETKQGEDIDSYSEVYQQRYVPSSNGSSSISIGAPKRQNYLRELIDVQQNNSGLREVKVDFDNRYYYKGKNEQAKGPLIWNMHENKENYASKKAKDQRFTIKYGKQSRMAQIMNLKVRPCYYSKTKAERVKQKFENNVSEKSESLLSSKNKSSTTRDKVSRFDKIMEIKVSKPVVCSTLINYQPKCIKRLDTPAARANRESSLVLIDKENRESIRRCGDRTEKQERMWKQEERQRQLSLRQNQITTERQYQAQRRKESIFEKLVQKQMIKIQRQREISQRQTEGFSKYVYPFY